MEKLKINKLTFFLDWEGQTLRKTPPQWKSNKRYWVFDWQRNPLYANKLNIINNSYRPNHNGGYDVKLLRNRSMIWSCDSDQVPTLPPFLQCLNYAISGKITTPQFILDKCGLTNEQFMNKWFVKDTIAVNPIHQHQLAILYNVVIDYHMPYPILGGQELKYTYSLGFDPVGNINPRIIGFLEMPNNTEKVKDYFTLLLPDIKNRLPLIHKFYYCETCNSWMSNKKWGQHLKECRKCLQCGIAYKVNSGHEKTCVQEHQYIPEKRTPKNQIRRYKLDTKINFNFNFYADFEAFVDEDKRNYEVYAASYMGTRLEKSRINDEIVEKWATPHIFYGKNSLDEFMRHVIHRCTGVMWFFNGARFDNFFIFEWLLRHKVEIDRRSLLISGNNILSIKFKTREGWIHLKDLAKFLNGSLASCCKNFGLSQDQSKTDFDHLKMTSWEKVMENEEECREYLKMDVISLRALQQVFAKLIFNILGVDLVKYMTLTQAGYASWSAKLDKKMKIYKTHTSEEKIMREMYKGGRVLCGRKEWRSRYYEQVMATRKDYMVLDKKLQEENPDLAPIFCMKEDGEYIPKELYEMIDDFLVYADVNSLYPAVQISIDWPLTNSKTGALVENIIDEIQFVEKSQLSHFPHGKHVITSYKDNPTDEAQFRLELNDRHELQKEKWYRRGVCVDITCPDDLTVAFLMTKHPKTGEVVQNLLPKVESWYTGPELWEASILGYKITKIHAICEWEKSSPMFETYVLPIYDLKSAQDTDGPKRAAAKALLNALTGKYGQKNIPKSVVLFDPNEEINVDVVDLTRIVDEKGETLKFYALEKKEFTHSPFPVELSAWILAYARIYMSILLRKMGIERGHGKSGKKYGLSPFYSDTDSLILHRKAWAKLQDDLKGHKKLGQLKEEVDGKIISFICLANKTYSFTYIDRETMKIMCVTKTKGIPHGGDPYNACQLYVASQEEQDRAMSHSKFLQNRRDKQFPSFIFALNSLNIKSRAYVFKDAITKETQAVCAKIPHEYLSKILDRSWTMECVFGGMVRQFKPGGLENLFIAPETKSRSLCLTDWWSQRKRIHSPWDHNEHWPSAYPVGHYKVKGQEKKTMKEEINDD